MQATQLASRLKLGFNLARAREKAGLTQVTAANRVGKPKAKIQAVERGRRGVEPELLRRFAELYGVSESTLLDGCQ